MIRPASQAALQTGNPVAHLGGGDRALQPRVVRPCARPRRRSRPDRLVGRRPRPQCRQAGRAAAERARAAQSGGRAQRAAADAPAICGAQGSAGGDAGDRRGEARPHPAQPRSLALAAARSWQQVHHRQRAGLLRDPGRERRQPLEAAGDRRQAVDADAAAQRDRGRGDHQSVRGTCPRASRRKPRARRASSRS